MQIDSAILNVTMITNNYFVTDLCMQGLVTFNATAGTIVSTNSWETAGFMASDTVHIYNSYRNDGYKSISTVSSSTMTVATGSTVVAELSGRSILVSVVQFPEELKPIVAQMVAYDVDVRPNQTPGVTSHSLGPFSESFAGPQNQSGGSKSSSGYPATITDQLEPFTIARLR